MFELTAKEQKIREIIKLYDQLQHSQTEIPNERTYEILIGLFAPMLELEMIGRYLTDMVLKYELYPTKSIVDIVNEIPEEGKGMSGEIKLQVKELKEKLKKILRKYKPKKQKEEEEEGMMTKGEEGEKKEREEGGEGKVVKKNKKKLMWPNQKKKLKKLQQQGSKDNTLIE